MKRKNYYYRVGLLIKDSSKLSHAMYCKLIESCHGHGVGFGSEDISWIYNSNQAALKKYRELMNIRTKYVSELSLIRVTK